MRRLTVRQNHPLSTFRPFTTALNSPAAVPPIDVAVVGPPAAVTSDHVPVRPLWVCRVCAVEWPCGPVRLALPTCHADDRIRLAAHLAALLRAAVGDTYRAGHRPDPARLHDRFLGWLTRPAVTR